MRLTARRALIAAAALALLALPVWGELQPKGPELRVNQHNDYRQTHPVAAVAPSGRAIVVWENDQLGLRGQLLAADGSAIGAEVVLAASDALGTLPVDKVIGTRRDPSVAIFPAGDFTVAWTEGVEHVHSDAFIESRETLAQSIFMQHFDATGQPAGNRVQINTPTAVFHSQPHLAARATGDLEVVWASSDGGVFARRMSAAGQALGNQIRLNDASDATGANPTLAAGPQGKAMVVWEAADGSGVGVFGRLLNASAQPVGPALRINTDTQGRQRHPAVAADAAGNYFAVWQGDLAVPTQARIFGQAIGAGGNLMGPQLGLIQGFGLDKVQMAPAIAAVANGHFLLSWLTWVDPNHGNIQVAAVELDHLGNAAAEPLWVSERGIEMNFRRTSVAANASGSVVIPWESVTIHGTPRVVIDARRLGN